MKTPITTFMLALFCLSLFAQAPSEVAPATPVPQGPITEMEFEEPVYDFGVVEEGELVRHVFTFTNTGDEPLVLFDAKGSCGCTVPKWPREPIAPGETASITVEFNSKNKKGKRNQRVTLSGNTDPAQTFLYLKGEVIPRDEATMPEVDFAETEATELDPSCFAIYPNPTAEILRLDMADHIGQAVTVSIYSKTGQRMAERQVDKVGSTMEFTVGHYPPGTYIANVQVAGKKAESKCFVVVE